jgi:hypothetical protein
MANPMSSEQRKNHRKLLKYPARVDLRDGSPLLRCLIRDISASGARVIVEDPERLPDHFHLLLTKAASAARECQVVWREGNQFGVEFIKTPVAKHTPPLQNSFKDMMRSR